MRYTWFLGDHTVIFSMLPYLYNHISDNVCQDDLGDHTQNTTNSAISLVVYIVIPLVIGPSARTLMNSAVYHGVEGTRPCPFPVTGNVHGHF